MINEDDSTISALSSIRHNLVSVALFIRIYATFSASNQTFNSNSTHIIKYHITLTQKQVDGLLRPRRVSMPQLPKESLLRHHLRIALSPLLMTRVRETAPLLRM